MAQSPYRRRPRLKVDQPEHYEGEVITLGKTRWLIIQLIGQEVTLTAANADPAVHWHTTLDKLPAPTKEKR